MLLVFCVGLVSGGERSGGLFDLAVFRFVSCGVVVCLVSVGDSGCIAGLLGVWVDLFCGC